MCGFKNLVFQAKKDPAIYSIDEQLSLIIDKLKFEMDEGLISCMISRRSTKVILASFNSQETMLPFFHNINSFIEQALVASSFPKLAITYKIYLSNNLVILAFLVKDIQVSIVPNYMLVNVGHFGTNNAAGNT
jgi:hypothetical protein